MPDLQLRVEGGSLDLDIRRLGVPKIRDTILRVPIVRIMVFWGLYWGLLLWETTMS